MEKQKLDRILEMIQSNETLREQYKENPDATINVMIAWLDAEEQGVDLDPYFSRKQAMEFGIQNLENELKAQKERGNLAEAELIARDIVIRKRMLPLIGKEGEYPEEVSELKEMQANLEEDRNAYVQETIDTLGPRL